MFILNALKLTFFKAKYVSSANRLIFESVFIHKSFIWIIKRVRPRIDPCGTPFVIIRKSSLLFLR